MRFIRPGLLAALAVFALAEPPAAGPGPVVLNSAGRHIGDNTSSEFTPAKPDGPEWSCTLPDIPTLPAGLFWGLAIRARDVVDANSRDYEGGGYVDEVRVDGVAVARLNDFVGPESAPMQEAWVPLPGVALKAGMRLAIAAGKNARSGNLDDFEISEIRLAPMRRVEIRTGGPAKVLVKDPPRLGPDYVARAAVRAVFSADGRAELLLPADATFAVTVSRGTEFEVAVGEIPKWSTDPVNLEPKRAFETPGMLSADFHVHADPSGDSRVPLPDRVTSYLAEGVEWVVATDHNEATDYGPAIRALGAEKLIRSSIGDEVTTANPRIGHFNVFPVTKPVDVAKMPVKDFLAHIDARAPRGRRVLQVNHGRDGGRGYFDILKFDPATATSPDPDFEFGFDAMEILNGKSDPRVVGVLLVDWYALLNSGHRLTATGNSDSHALVLEDGGWPRNYVVLGHEGFPTEDELIEAVRAHRVVISCGPVLDVQDQNGHCVVGEELSGGPVEVTVRLRTPSWAPVKRLLVVANGKTIQTLEPRAEQKVTLAAGKDAWYVFIAEGDRFEADVVTNERLRPWGMTNPVWVRP